MVFILVRHLTSDILLSSVFLFRWHCFHFTLYWIAYREDICIFCGHLDHCKVNRLNRHSALMKCFCQILILYLISSTHELCHRNLLSLIQGVS